MTRWAAFEALCEHLRAGVLGSGPPPADPANWELVIEASSYHLVTPALAWCLRDRADLPDDIREYLEAALALNARRNELLLDQLERLVQALNRIEVEPVLLKAAAHLVEDLYPVAGFRVLGDLDLLIPAERARDVAAAAAAIGFASEVVAGWLHVPDNHLPKMIDRDSGAGVDLHTEVAVAGSQAILPVSWFWPRTHAASFRGARVRIPDSTAMIVHNIVHHQLDHGYYRGRRIELRQLLDFVLLRARYRSAIDWADVERRFVDGNAGEALGAYLGFAEVLLGQVPPAISVRAQADAIDQLRAGIERPRRRPWARLGYIASDYVARLRRRPTRILNLLNVRMWPAYIGVILSAWQLRKW